MFKTIIITCGISLFSPFNSFGKWTREQSYFQFKRNGPYVPIEEENECIKKWFESCIVVISKNNYDPKAVSAEYSLLHALRKLGKLKENPHIKLFCTNTTGGKTVSKLLEYIFAKDFEATVETIIIDHIDVSSQKELFKGIAKYMELLSMELKGEQTDTTCFAPIGGYKVLTSFGYIIGAFHGFPTAYLHEDSQVLHTIPPVPLKIDEQFIQDNYEFLHYIHNSGGCLIENLNSNKIILLEKHSYFFEQNSNQITLNPFGLFILRYYQKIGGCAI